MSMNYFLSPYPYQEVSIVGNGAFPEGLSYFFEQVGGYDDASEAGQLEQLFSLDLSVFQSTRDIAVEEDLPVDLSLLFDAINDLLRCINSTPDYYEKLRWNDFQAEKQQAQMNDLLQKRKLDGSLDSLNAAHQEISALEERQKTERLMSSLDTDYPPNRLSYFKSGDFAKDLNLLREMLLKFQGEGITKAELVYM